MNCYPAYNIGYVQMKDGHAFTAFNNTRQILNNNTGVITSIVKLAVHSPVGKLV